MRRLPVMFLAFLAAFAPLAEAQTAAPVPPATAPATPDEVLPPAITDQAEASAFLAAFAGQWRGRGWSRSGFTDDEEASQCTLTITYDAAATTLNNSGRCANTHGGVTVDGTLGIGPNGTLTGGFFNRFQNAELISSSGQILQDRFYVVATYNATIDRQQQQVEVQVWVSKPEPNTDGVMAYGLIAQVRNPATGELVDFSNMVFTP